MLKITRFFLICSLLCFFPVMIIGANTDNSNLVVTLPHEEIILNLNDLPPEESSHYAFLFGYQAILEKKCNGAFLAFTEDNTYVGGFLTENAPDDFCTKISPNTICVSEPISKDTIMSMYSLLGDRMSLSSLMNRQENAFVGVVMFEVEENMVLTPLWYAQSEERLEKNAIALGLNPNDLYLIMAENGYDKDSLIASVESGISPSDIVKDALKIQNDIIHSEKNQKSNFIKNNTLKGTFFLGTIVIVLFLSFLIIFSIAQKKIHREISLIRKEKKNI